MSAKCAVATQWLRPLNPCTVRCVPVITQPFGCCIGRPSVALIVAHKSLSCLQGTDLEQSGSEGRNDVQTPGKRRSADVGADLAGQLSLKRLKINKNNFTGLEQQGCHTSLSICT